MFLDSISVTDDHCTVRFKQTNSETMSKIDEFLSETSLSSFSLENAYEVDCQMQSSVSRISKFLFLNQEYQHDQQNSLQNSTQIVLVFFDQNQNSDYFKLDSNQHDRYSCH